MKTIFLQQKRFSTLAVFFCGWGVDETAFSNLALPKKSDLLFIGRPGSDDDFSLPHIDSNQYLSVDVAAWSLGVLVATETLRRRPDFQRGRCVAIAGSSRPHGSKFGIDAAVFDGTIENWANAAARENFYRRVFGRRAAFAPTILADFSANAERTAVLAERQAELRSLRELALRPFDPDFQPFDVAVVCERDRIFPCAALERFWSRTNAKVRRIDAPHSPFDSFDGWDEVFQ